MSSLLNPAKNLEIINRIEKLTPNSNPLWGKMNGAQMLAHCQVTLRVASGEQKLKRGLIGILFGGMAKKQLLKDEPFKKNLPTAPEFKVNDIRKFEEEKQRLVSLIKDFEKKGPNGLTKDPHPFFGKLTVQEWDTLQYKHLDHHLRQFGA